MAILTTAKPRKAMNTLPMSWATVFERILRAVDMVIIYRFMGGVSLETLALTFFVNPVRMQHLVNYLIVFL